MMAESAIQRLFVLPMKRGFGLRFRLLLIAVLTAICLALPADAAAQEPALPDGLGGEDSKQQQEQEGPTLPSGLGKGSATEQPAGPKLPAGLEEKGQTPTGSDKPDRSLRDRLPFKLSGFWEVRGGMRVVNDPDHKQESLGETRLQLEMDKYWKEMSFELTADLVYDPVGEEHEVNLEDGEGAVDLREARLTLSPSQYLDLRLGRQVLTWGTGDQIFINDLFPKDWRSFFIGRDVAYLKAPSDALKASFFSGPVNLDIVYTPRFDADRFINGERISYWSSRLGRLAGRDAVIEVDKPDDWFQDDEIAARIYRNLAGYELAAYFYDGFWKSPAGQDPLSGKAFFPKLRVYGASLRGTLGPGVANLELGYYDSREDSSGEDPFVANSELRLLLGYEQEIAEQLTLGLQYYLEHMLDYEAYRRTLPGSMEPEDEDQQQITLRLTKQLLMETLELSLFTYYSPTAQDVHLRPEITYDLTDAWTLDCGANLFYGQDRHTFFGQFENNSNVYLGLRYSF